MHSVHLNTGRTVATCIRRVLTASAAGMVMNIEVTVSSDGLVSTQTVVWDAKRPLATRAWRRHAARVNLAGAHVTAHLILHSYLNANSTRTLMFWLNGVEASLEAYSLFNQYGLECVSHAPTTMTQQ
jgi:mRNA-degrading endonuclease toxin of MazEF toxin-antitoxin module